ASGTIASADAGNTRIGFAPNAFRPSAIGMKTSSQFRLMRSLRHLCIPPGERRTVSGGARAGSRRGGEPYGATSGLLAGSPLNPSDEDPHGPDTSPTRRRVNPRGHHRLTRRRVGLVGDLLPGR